jgi:L,D-transpeptidase YcbB
MGGRSLVARFGATTRVFVFAVSVAGAAYAVDGPVAAPSADSVPVPPNAVEQASTPGEADPQSPDPAAAPASEDDAPAGPADAVETTTSRPDDGDQKPADSAATPPSETANPAVAAEQPPADPIVAAIRSKLADPALRKGVASDDLAALQAFYAERSGPPLWITGMGFSARAEAVIGDIQNADDWGLSSEAFDLPPAGHLPATTEAQATDEIKLSLAILKYARAARGGRVTPSRINVLFDQKLDLRRPKTVMSEIAAAAAPDAYLRSLQPKHEQFERLRQALIKARANAEARGRKPVTEPLIQRLIVNMERWRWMPAQLGSYYVWNNVPAFTARVIKNGKSIYVEKVIVGQLKYATPIFSSPMRSIVFNPEWTVPETVKLEDLQPRLRQAGFFGERDISILRQHKLSVSYQGRPVDAETIDWGRANILHYTFTQPPGPENVLGALKFNFPNRHAVYMHDTVQPELFAETVRTLSHGCIRVHQPDRLAALLLAEDRGWSPQQVKSMIASGKTSVVPLKRHVPVHLTYFTTVVDDQGKVQTFADVYGLDSKLGAALLGKAVKLQAAPTVEAAAQVGRRKEGAWRAATQTGGLADSISGLFGN